MMRLMGSLPIIMIVIFFPFIVFSATFQITNTQDTGNGSLSWAITQANNSSGPDTLEFNISTADPNFVGARKYWAIRPLTQLPSITDDSTFVDGSSQQQNSGIENPGGKEVAIEGNNLPTETPGFVINSKGNIFQDFSIGGFRGVTFDFVGTGATYNNIKNCFIGISPNGRWGYNIKESLGIRFFRGANYNTVGGTGPNDKNIISGFNRSAILIDDNAGYNRIIGNIFGLAANGLDPIGNGWEDFDVFSPGKPARGGIAGILFRGVAHHNIVGGAGENERNVICASGRAGVRIETVGSDSNKIQGNYIGVAVDGETAVPNGEAGIQIAYGAAFTQIGGTKPGEGNVVASNWSSGIQLRNNIHHNKVQGNYIGTNANGSALVPNSHNGIYIFGDSGSGFPEDNEIGPGNIIIANAEEDEDERYGYTWGAVRLDSSGTTRNIVHGNWLGTNKDGSLANQWNSGVIVGGGAHHNQIGPDNIIANNHKWGIWIRQEKTLNNTITQNQVYNNGWGAIVLEEGGNTLVDPPLITSTADDIVKGKTASEGTVEFFRSEAGQADKYIATVDADENGDFSWDGGSVGQNIVATFTDAEGNSSALSNRRTVPVEFAAFTAVRSNGKIQLSWTTESETNNLGFYIERKHESYFEEIGFIEGAGTSSTSSQYAFLDGSNLSGTINYRLRQVDFDGSVSYSKTISVNLTVPHKFSLSQPYPNPFNNTTIIAFDLPKEQHVELSIYNVLGRRIKTLVERNMTAGSHQLHWNGTNNSGMEVPSGQYFVKIKGEKETLVQRVLLLK